MYTLQDIKNAYYLELANGETDRMSLDDYIRENYIPCYDAELNFEGYDRK